MFFASRFRLRTKGRSLVWCPRYFAFAAQLARPATRSLSKISALRLLSRRPCCLDFDYREKQNYLDQTTRLSIKSDLHNSAKKHSNELGARGGFTLVETLVALAVILAATVGPVSLITRGLSDFSFSKNKLIATNLAQEGIELIRAVRETNIVCDILNGPTVWPWNENPELPNPPSGNTFSTATAGIAVDLVTTTNCNVGGGVSIVVPILSASCLEKLRFDPATGIYGNSGPEQTIFTRCVSIQVPSNSPDSGIPAADQMDIISTVTWNEKGNSKSMILQERLYNWR